MLKNYSKLWVFGDSYATPNVCVEPKDSFWGLTAQHANIDTIINCANSGNSFDTVCQLLVGMQQEYNWADDLFLIGVPPLERITVFDNYKNTEYTGQQINATDWSSVLYPVESHRGLITLQNYGSDKTLIMHTDRAWVETSALRTIFLLTAWLDSVNANYIIANLSKPFDKDNVWGPSSFVLPYAVNHPRLNLFDDTYYGVNFEVNRPADYNVAGWYGHHGPAGNQHFFEQSLWPKMQQCGLV